MAKRKIITIDEEKCNGCGECVPNCAEGAIQMIDNKARLISDLFCDGLGACIGTCPQGAITIEEREAEKYDEKKVMELNIIPKGKNVIQAHLDHLKEHGELKYLSEAIEVLKAKGVEVPHEKDKGSQCGCPGAKMMMFAEEKEPAPAPADASEVPSALRQWPIQLHLVSPLAPYYQKRDVLLVADCVAFSYGSFHQKFLKGNPIAIACPKLDSEKENYIEKLKIMIEESGINTLTVMIMEVPCCSGLLMLAQQAAAQAGRKIPIKKIVISLKGDILQDTWV